MTKFIAIASSKGGTGKTTVALNLGLCLNNFGREAVVFDGNFSSPHVSLYLGSPLNPISIHNALRGENHITEAVYNHSSGLKIVPQNLYADSDGYVELSKLKETMHGLKGRCEAVIIDCPPGFGKNIDEIFKASDEVILVTTPDMLSVTEALKTKKRAERNGAKVAGVVINKAGGHRAEMTYQNIQQMLGLPVLEIIPFHDDVVESMYMKYPVAYSHPGSQVTTQFKKLAAKLIGERYAENIEKYEEESSFSKVLKSLGLK